MHILLIFIKISVIFRGILIKINVWLKVKF